MKKNRLGKEHLEDRALSRFPFLKNESVTTCPKCEGQGGYWLTYWYGDWNECTRCDGDGKIKQPKEPGRKIKQ